MSATTASFPSVNPLLHILGSLWFLFLAVFVAYGTVTGASTLSWSQIGSSTVLGLFYALLWLLVILRPAPTSTLSGLAPNVAAFVGTYLPWTITIFVPRVSNQTSPVLVMIGAILMVVTVLHLGRSFSLVPQARKVVGSGPYRFIRHPLYLAEEIAIVGVMLGAFSLVSLGIVIVHIAVQIYRIHFEETLLRQTLPAYAIYGQTARWRLIPYVW